MLRGIVAVCALAIASMFRFEQEETEVQLSPPTDPAPDIDKPFGTFLLGASNATREFMDNP